MACIFSYFKSNKFPLKYLLVKYSAIFNKHYDIISLFKLSPQKAQLQFIQQKTSKNTYASDLWDQLYNFFSPFFLQWNFYNKHFFLLVNIFFSFALRNSQVMDSRRKQASKALNKIDSMWLTSFTKYKLKHLAMCWFWICKWRHWNKLAFFNLGCEFCTRKY